MNRCYGFNVYTLLTLTIVTSWLHTGIAQRELNRNDNEGCKARPTLVAIGSPNFHYLPIYVTLHRCGGSVDHFSPRSVSCVADTTSDVKINAHDLINVQVKTFMEKNHTSCKPQCADEDMCDPDYEQWNADICGCTCNYPDGPPEPCPARFKWDKDLCRCECDEDANVLKCIKEKKIWSYDKCGCECTKRVVSRCKRKKKYLKEDTCECVNEPVLGAQESNDAETCISKVLLFGIIIGEILVLLLVLDVCLYMKGFGFIFYLRKVVCHSNKDKDNPPLSPSANHDKTSYL